ncbi:hypothetical protein Dimus_019770 [Dionaea muscipula]
MKLCLESKMFRLSCLNPQIQNQKQKKQGQPSFETLLKMLQNGYQNPCLDASPREAEDANYDLHDERGHHMITSPVNQRRMSQEITSNHSAENNSERMQIPDLRRSRSLGSELEEGGVSVENSREDFSDDESSCDGSRYYVAAELSPPAFDMRDLRITSPDQEQEVLISESPQIGSDQLNNEFMLSVSDPQDLGKEDHEICDMPIYFESTGDSVSRTPQVLPKLARSSSMPDIGSISPTSRGYSPCICYPRNRSFGDLNALDVKKKGTLSHGASTTQGQEDLCMSDKCTRETAVRDEYGYYDQCGSLNKDWIVPVNDEIKTAENYQEEDFKLKRIEEWVMDLQNCGPVEEIISSDLPASLACVQRGSALLDGIESSKLESKINPDIEAAKKYISSLNPAASTAQLANHGLAVIPFLSAFVSLKVLNLSGNSIVRITAGALPRGLHMLNLSKNKISTIEGLRELTRLRVLDLSYNKIVRIGHGLGSCSSLKELYLAGNKISEVEGLHRLLKLNILDLRFNKLSTSKCLGQLAANYNSLHAISLEGNPAQKNVGDEQMKKYLQGLLPHLVYYGRHPVKSSKEISDRSVRLGLGVSAHQHDRFPRSDHKPSPRRRSHGGLAALKQTSQVVDSPKRSRGSRHGNKTTNPPPPPSSSRLLETSF